MSQPPALYVLVGVNGAGKSSIGETIFRAEGSEVYNPDTIAQKIRSLHPHISAAQANGHAWQIGKELLEEAIAQKRDYLFETTLGGRSIARILQTAALAGHQLHIWFCGLESPELHLRRVRARVSRGGPDIPEEKIHERWNSSRENLIRLLPCIHHLRLYDNSIEADPANGQAPCPRLLLEMKTCKITAPADLTQTPDWAQPIVAAAVLLHREAGS
jgi:predicted ABC-type ATPase